MIYDSKKTLDLKKNRDSINSSQYNREQIEKLSLPQNLVNFLEVLPIPAIVKTADHEIVFENSASISLFGENIGRPCYSRFVSSLNECKCPLKTETELRLDVKEVRHVKQEVVLENNKRKYLAIINIPMFLDQDEPVFYIELVKDFTNDFLVELLVKGEDAIENIELLWLVAMRFREFDQSILASDDLKEILSVAGLSESELFLKLQNYAFAAIGQGHHWPEGLFGPVPLLNIKDYNVFYYATKLPFVNSPKDKRLKEDLILIAIITKEKAIKLFSNRENVENIISSFINENISSSEEITKETLKILKQKLYDYLKKRLNNMII